MNKMLDIAQSFQNEDKTLPQENFLLYAQSLVRSFMQTIRENSSSPNIEHVFRNAPSILESHFKSSSDNTDKWLGVAMQDAKMNDNKLYENDISKFGRSILQESVEVLRQHGEYAKLSMAMNSMDTYIGFNAVANLIQNEYQHDNTKKPRI